MVNSVNAYKRLARPGPIILSDKPGSSDRNQLPPPKIAHALLVVNFKHFPTFVECENETVCWVRYENEVDDAFKQQYIELSVNLRQKLMKNPVPEELRRVCAGLHKKIGHDRVLLHFVSRGHPNPSNTGHFTTGKRAQRISLRDIHRWVESKVMLVLDFPKAGLLIESLCHDKQLREDTIIMAACRKDEDFKGCPNVPADLFTSCLTTPLKMALRYHMIKFGRMLGLTDERLADVPGKLNQRPTMKGELNWILTAILDAIAWNSFDSVTFGRFYRQDAVMASLFRNYLLADRIMPLFDCHPMTYPALKSCKSHHMWQQWDYVMDMAFTQRQNQLQFGNPIQPFSYFGDQMKAFDIWISGCIPERPEQLPIILQILLSPIYRYRALELLAKFTADFDNVIGFFHQLDMFPYIVKIIKTGFNKFATPLLKICVNVLTLDISCRELLQIDRTWLHFQKTFDASQIFSDEDRANALFIFEQFLQDHPETQRKAREQDLVSICLNLLETPTTCWKIRQRSILCLGSFWDGNVENKKIAVSSGAYKKVLNALDDDATEIRAAAYWALGTFFANNLDKAAENDFIEMIEKVSTDINCAVRKVFLGAIQHVIANKLTENQVEPILNCLSMLKKDPNLDVAEKAQFIFETLKLEPPPEHLSSYFTVFDEISAAKLTINSSPKHAKRELDHNKRNTWNGRSKIKHFCLNKDSTLCNDQVPQNIALNPTGNSMVLSNTSLLVWKSLVADSELRWNVQNASTDTTVNSLRFIATNLKTPVLAGYSDGTVRLWDTTREISPLASFRAFNNSSPLYLEWHKQTERVVAASAGENVVQLWDLPTERKILNFATGSVLPLTCITCSSDSISATGFHDGHVRVFDWRLPHDNRCIAITPSHPSAQPILTIAIRNEDSSLACCLRGGSFCRIDLRIPQKLLANWHADRGSVLATVHPTAPLVAFGGSMTRAEVCVYNLDGKVQSRFTSVHATAMVFHQEQHQLAVGESDGKVTFYSDRRNTI